MINSYEMDPKEFASCQVPEKEPLGVPECELPGLNMVQEQSKDSEILELKTALAHGDPSEAIKRRYLIENDIVYLLSDPDDNPTLHLCIPKQLRQLVVKQYHDDNGHIDVQKTYSAIRQKYYWPNLFKELYDYVSACTICQTRSAQKVKSPIQGTGIPLYAFAKLSLDLLGLYPKSLSGYTYIIAFVDWYIGWPEAFAAPDKMAETIAHLIVNEIFPRFGCLLELVTDNGSENCNKVVKETLEVLNIHVRTSYYSPQSNSRVEHLHHTLHDVRLMVKTLGTYT